MSEFNEAVIRAQLRAKGVNDPITVEQFHVTRNRLNNRGEVVLARSYLRWLYSIRLERAIERAPQHTELQASMRAALAALELVADDELIYSWTASTPKQKWIGFSTPQRLILTAAENLTPDDPDYGILRFAT